MRAVVYERHGPPEVMTLREVPRPEPGDDEVLIRVRAAEVTKSDCEMRAGTFPVKWFWLPLRLVIGLRKPKRRQAGNLRLRPETPEELAELKSLVEDGRLRPIVERVLVPEQAIEAHRLVEDEQRTGAIVLALGGPD